MQVSVRFVGLIGRDLGLPPGSVVSIELSGDGTLRDLLCEIDNRFSGRFPPNTWDADERRFHENVQAFQDGLLVREPEEPLRDGAEISFLVSMAGGVC